MGESRGHVHVCESRNSTVPVVAAILLYIVIICLIGCHTILDTRQNRETATILQNSTTMAITFESADATYFNFVSELASVGIHYIFGLAVAFIYTLFVRWHLRQKNSSIPVGSLGAVPKDANEAFQLSTHLGWSVPALRFFLVLLIPA